MNTSPSSLALEAQKTGWAVGQFDAIEFMRGLPSGIADLVITDFPYESLEKHRARGTTTRLKHSTKSSNDWFRVFPNTRIPDLIADVYRLMKPNRHAYMFCDDETSDILKPLARQVGFRYVKRLVWDKVCIGMGYHYRARYEFILFMEKGTRKLADLGLPDVLVEKRLAGKDVFPTEKPVPLMKTLVSQSALPNELVVDPFCGSGSVGVAARAEGCKFLGNDIDEKAVNWTKRRLMGGPEDHAPEADASV